ncbi:MAG TPA: DUF1592 domain-containing protein, partial [Planctomycetes bacterium]|nr:DUF1592 domain-containing protein [Planctomycetota bacterium]
MTRSVAPSFYLLKIAPKSFTLLFKEGRASARGGSGAVTLSSLRLDSPRRRVKLKFGKSIASRRRFRTFGLPGALTSVTSQMFVSSQQKQQLTMKLLTLTICLVATSLIATAQEDSEEVQEIGAELRDAQREQRHLQQRLELTNERIALLTELHTMRRALDRFARQIAEARENDDERTVERLAELRGDGNIKPLSLMQRENLPASIQLTDTEIVAAGRQDFHQQIIPLLKAACFECHDGESANGDLDLEALVGTTPLVVNRSHWINVIQQLKVRSMPPADADQPSEADRRTMAAWLTNSIENFDYSTVRQPGYEPARRLTHAEYNNTVRDLTGIDLRPADRFPVDMTATSGFENSANSLFVQPILMERYVGAAEAIVAGAWPDKSVASPAQRVAWRTLLGDVRDLSANGAAEDVLRRFATRAYRRPIQLDELESLTSYFKQRVRDGASAETALKDILQAILVSPNFLIRAEQNGPQTDGAFPITDWELAGRLSYFLWASMPDDELFRLAESNQLRQPGVLAGQVDRMLSDPRARTLGSLFAAQWLGFADLGRVRPGPIDSPWATDSLIESMQRESAMLFHSLVQQNEPVDRLIDADYTFVNEELAKHYRMAGVAGDQMRRVSLKDGPRRGVLGHGSILAVTSFPGRTSPVIRGNWILTRLLGTPPPPPPPNVSEFDERVAENRRLTQRQKLEAHRDNPNCYACHSQIDPLGFALEEFEWFGRHQPTKRGKPVDATGKLPGGKTFRGLTGLSQTLLHERLDELTTQLTRKMLSYALGRQLEYYDEATVRDLVQQLQADGRRLQTVVHAIVQSD